MNRFTSSFSFKVHFSVIFHIFGSLLYPLNAMLSYSLKEIFV